MAAHPLAPFGWNDRVRALTADASGVQGRPGRVARVDRGVLTAVTESGVERLSSRGLDATTGDWVMLAAGESTVVEVLPRWSVLARHGPGRAAVSQLLAANIDVGFVVVGLDREPNLPRLDRLLTLIWSSGAQPVVVLAKSDLADAPEQLAADIERSTVGVEVVVASAVTGRGVGPLRDLLPPGDTAVLIGESGAGKSSLVNALAGAEVQAVGGVRGGDHKGRHTTRARELVPVPGGGVLLDTPGLRSVALAAGQQPGLDHTFADVVALADRCRFADCEHDAEPGCAVREAVAEGALDPRRVASFHDLRREAASAAGRADRRGDRAASRIRARHQEQLADEQHTWEDG